MTAAPKHDELRFALSAVILRCALLRASKDEMKPRRPRTRRRDQGRPADAETGSEYGARGTRMRFASRRERRPRQDPKNRRAQLLARIFRDQPELRQGLPDKGDRSRYLRGEQQQIAGCSLLLVVRGHRGEDIRSISASLKASVGAELWGRQDQRGPATPAASPGLLGRVPTRAATANQLRRVPRSCSASAKLPRFNFWMRSQKSPVRYLGGAIHLPQ